MTKLKVKSLLLFQSDRPMVLSTISFASGIGISLHCNHYCFSALAGGILCLVIAAYIAYCKARTHLSFSLAQIAILSCGLLMNLAHRDGYNPAHLRALLSAHAFPLNEPVLFEGRIDREDSSTDREIEVIVTLEKYRLKNTWSVAMGKGILRIATTDRLTHSHLKETLARGIRLRAWAVWKMPQNFENPGSIDRKGILSRRGIFVIGRTKSARLIEFIGNRAPGLPNTIAAFVRNRAGKMLAPQQPNDKRQPEAMLGSLLIGDKSGLDQKTREIFQNTGSFHILVVSGLHVAWISGTWLIILKILRIPELVRYISTAALILLYTWVIGFQPGITRCLWMFYLYLAGRWLFRRTGSVNILFSAALLLLAWNPDHLLEAGYQLSFLSVAAITLTALPVIESVLKPILEPMRHAGRQERLYLNPGRLYRWGRRLRTYCELCSEGIEDLFPRIRSDGSCFLIRCIALTGLAAGSMILLSLSVQLWIAPLLGFYFNRISWIAPAANLLLVPVASVTLATGILAL
ncbi:MAG: ComEC/Rec2 family competence protein, partial [Acidobacteriota bacterium]